MAGGSMFATQANLDLLNKGLSQIETAIHEAELAVSAGLPGAEEMLAKAKEAQASALKIKRTYYPDGTAPAG